MRIKQGDLVTFKPERSDPGEETVTYRAIENEDGGRVKVLAELGLPINPTQVISVEWVVTVNGQPLAASQKGILERRQKGVNRASPLCRSCAQIKIYAQPRQG